MSQPRKWLSFSIKDLIWLTVVISLSLSWRLHYASMEAIVKEVQSNVILHQKENSLHEESRTRADMFNAEQIEYLERDNKTLRGRIRELRTQLDYAEPSRSVDASHLTTVQRLTDENKSLKSQLKVKEAELAWAKAIIPAASDAEVEVPPEAIIRPTKKETTKGN